MIKRSCPKCGGTLILYFSTKEKQCSVCYEYIPWNLDEGQKPIFSDSVRGDVEVKGDEKEKAS